MGQFEFSRRPTSREIERRMRRLFACLQRPVRHAQPAEQEFDIVLDYLSAASAYLANKPDASLAPLKRRIQGLKDQLTLSKEDWMRTIQSLATMVTNLEKVSQDLALTGVNRAVLESTGPDRRGTYIISKVDPNTIADLRRGAST